MDWSLLFLAGGFGATGLGIGGFVGSWIGGIIGVSAGASIGYLIDVYIITTLFGG